MYLRTEELVDILDTMNSSARLPEVYRLLHRSGFVSKEDCEGAEAFTQLMRRIFGSSTLESARDESGDR